MGVFRQFTIVLFSGLFALSTATAVADSVDQMVAKLTEPLTKENTLDAAAQSVVDKFAALTVEQQKAVYGELTALLVPQPLRRKGLPPRPPTNVVATALAAVAPLAKTPAVRKEAAEAVVPATANGNTEVRRLATWALGRFAEPTTFPTLLRVAAEDKSSNVRKVGRLALAEALRDTKEAGFASLLATHGDENLYEWLHEAKGNTFAERIETVVPSIAGQIDDKDTPWEERWRAVRLLGQTNSDAAEKALVARLVKIEDPQDPGEKVNAPSFNLRTAAVDSLIAMGRRKELRGKDVQESLRHQLKTDSQDVSDATRAAIAHALGFSGDRANLPLLVNVLVDKDNAYDKFVRTGAFLGLKELAKNLSFAEPLGRAVLPLVKHKDPWLQGAALEILENIGDRLNSPALRDQIDQEVAKVRGNGAVVDACKLLCDMVDAADKWDFKPKKPADVRYNAGSMHPTESFPLAVTSLRTLALLSAAPYCEKAKAPAEELKKYWADEKGSVARAFANHRVGAFRLDGYPYNSNAIYAEAFAVHIYRTLLSEEKDEDVRKRHTESLKAAEEQLEKTLGMVKEAGDGHPFPSSVFQTHAFTTTLLATEKTPAGAEKLASALAERAKKAATIPYYPTWTEPGTERGSAPRSVSFFLSRVKAFLDGTTTVNPKEKLMEALEVYGRHARLYAAHATRDGTHGLLSTDQPTDAIAPYYYWANIAQASTALRYLESGDLTAEEKKRVAWVKRRHLEALATLRDTDGTFKSPGVGTYPGGKTWGNAFAALALVPLIDECGGKKVPPSLGPWLPKKPKVEAARPHSGKGTAIKESSKGKTH